MSRSCVETDPGTTRPAATLIYFYLRPGESSAWHRVRHDEIWMWHGPGRLVLELGGRGRRPGDEVATSVLGPALAAGERGQVLVPGGVWQATRPGPDPVLVSCLVSPGFDFADFELAGP